MRQIKTKQADNFDFDLSLPPKVLAILRDVPGLKQRHALWIAHALGGYRASVRVSATTPDAATVKDHLKRMANVADDLAALIGMLPVDVRQSVESFRRVYDAGGEHSLVSRIEALQDALPALAERAQQQAALPSPKGRAALWDEMLLLCDVAGALEDVGMKVSQAATTALAIVRAAGVRISAGSRANTDPRRAIREFRNEHPGA